MADNASAAGNGKKTNEIFTKENTMPRNNEAIVITIANLYITQTFNGQKWHFFDIHNTSPFHNDMHLQHILNNVKAIAVGYTCFDAVIDDENVQAVQKIPIEALCCTPLTTEEQQWINKGQQLLNEGLLTRYEFLHDCAQGQYYDPESNMLYKPAPKREPIHIA